MPQRNITLSHTQLQKLVQGHWSFGRAPEPVFEGSKMRWEVWFPHPILAKRFDSYFDAVRFFLDSTAEAREIYRLERYQGLTRKKGDEGLWGVQYCGNSIQEVVDQYNANPAYKKLVDLRIVKCMTIDEEIEGFNV